MNDTVRSTDQIDDWGSPVAGIALAVRVRSEAGEVDLDVFVGNLGEEPFELVVSNPRAMFEVELRTTEGESVALSERGQQLIEAARTHVRRMFTTTLAPRQVHSEELDVSSMHDLEPGTYRATVRYEVSFGSEVVGTATSNEGTFEV